MNVLMETKECEVCKAALHIVKSDEREVAYEVFSGEEHDCFDVPGDAEVLVMDDVAKASFDDDCNCGH